MYMRPEMDSWVHKKNFLSGDQVDLFKIPQIVAQNKDICQLSEMKNDFNANNFLLFHCPLNP